MPRKRIFAITETLADLRRLERRSHDATVGLRLRILQALKRNGMLSTAEVADAVGCSERTVLRVVRTYRQEGIEGITASGAERIAPRVDRSTWQQTLQRRIVSGRLAELNAVRSWLAESAGLTCSLSETRFIVRSLVPDVPSWLDNEPSPTESIALQPTPELIAFLTALPTTTDTDDWNHRFRTALARLLAEVDHITVNVNTGCRLWGVDTNEREMVFTQHFSSDTAMRSGDVASSAVQIQGERESVRILRELRQQGRPLDAFHPPLARDYYFDGRSYLGTMIFFREHGKRTFSDATIATIDALEEFIIYAMSNHVAWVQRSLSGETVFDEAVMAMTSDADLSPQEERVAVHHLLGHARTVMARDLAVSVSTVKNHIASVHRKTGTSSRSELIEKYLTPFVIKRRRNK